ncbi:hypothetical protein RUM44_006339 [Polyplax serrata]|uniref:Uncharacterized protein n=1 Tax=Polyplax serrata TaxID=468196 RepID=A0ABR1AHU9_POLSC
MSTRFYDTVGSDDTVRLLSNPLNNEGLQIEEVAEDVWLNNSTSDCSPCCPLLKNEASNVSLRYVDSDHPVQTSLNGDYHHCHQFAPAHGHAHSTSKLVLTLCLCLMFMIAEMIGGYLAGSVAIVSDGAHLLIDVLGFVISLIAITTSKRKGTTKFNLGFFRIEVLTTVTSILLIWFMTAVFLYIATNRLIDGNYDIEVNTMIIISSLGVIINIVMISVLHGNCCSHHIHSHSVLREKSKGSQNINVQAAIVHVIGDLVQSIGVFVSSLIIKFYPQAKFMDPVCTFVFSIIVIFSTLRLLRDCLNILMEGVPKSIEYNNILVSLQGLNGVLQVHGLSVWSLTVDKNVLNVHLAVDDTVDRDLLLFQAQKMLSTNYGISNHTIQIERFHPKCGHPGQTCWPLWS